MTTWLDRIGTRGVWAPTDGMSLDDAVRFATRLEELGYGCLWLPETVGRDPFVHVAHLAGEAPTLTFATGIANIHHRHPGVMLQAANAITNADIQQAGRYERHPGKRRRHQPLTRRA